MKANNDKHLEKFTDKLMKDASLDKPSIDFTAKVMAEVLVTDAGAIVYKPLISKRAWVIIFTAVAACICYVIFNADRVTTNDWFKTDGFTAINTKFQQGLSAIKISAISLYAVVLLTAMFFIQIVYLKGYLNKRAAGQ